MYSWAFLIALSKQRNKSDTWSSIENSLKLQTIIIWKSVTPITICEDTQSLQIDLFAQRKWHRVFSMTKCENISLAMQKVFYFYKIFSINVTKFARNWGFDHIYWRNLLWKNSFFDQCCSRMRVHNVRDF